MTATNTEIAKVRPGTGPSWIEGYVTCEGGQCDIRTAFSKITCVSLTQKHGINANLVPADFDFHTSDGAITIYIYSNNQDQGDDVVYYRIAGLL